MPDIQTGNRFEAAALRYWSKRHNRDEAVLLFRVRVSFPLAASGVLCTTALGTTVVAMVRGWSVLLVLLWCVSVLGDVLFTARFCRELVDWARGAGPYRRQS